MLRRTLTLCAVFAFGAWSAVAAVPQDDAPAKPVEKITFTAKKLTAGDTTVASNKMNMDLNMSILMNGQAVGEQAQKMTQTSKHKAVVLAVDEKGDVSKIKITFEEHEQKVEGIPEDMVPESSLAGKTFLIEKTGAEFKVTDGEGGPVADDLAKSVKSEAVRGGKLGGNAGDIEKVLTKAPIAVGETVVVPEATVKELFNDDGSGGKMEMRKASMSMTCTGKSKTLFGEVGLFDVTVAVEMGLEENMVMKWNVKGKAEVGTNTCFLHKLELEGPLKMTGSIEQEEMSLELSGDGTIKMAMTAAFGKDKTVVTKP